MTLSIEEVQFKIRMLMLEQIINNTNVVISKDAIDKLGEVTINRNHV